MTAAALMHFKEHLRLARIQSAPWSFSYLHEALSTECALRLSGLFGQLDLVLCERNDGLKPYRFRTATLQAASQCPDPHCVPLLHFLHSQEYRLLMTRLTGVALQDRPVTLSFWEYQGGDWLAPHVDKANKLVTQIFYLTQGWTDGEGGRLLILRDHDLQSVEHALPPLFGSSAIIVRSDNSWHAVERVPLGASPRKSLTVTFWSDGPDQTVAGAPTESRQ